MHSSCVALQINNFDPQKNVFFSYLRFAEKESFRSVLKILTLNDYQFKDKTIT
jgi:hypothetical protein